MPYAHDVLLIGGHKEGGSEEVRWRYEFEGARKRSFEFYAIDIDDARQFLDDLKDALGEKPEIALDAGTHNR